MQVYKNRMKENAIYKGFFPNDVCLSALMAIMHGMEFILCKCAYMHISTIVCYSLQVWVYKCMYVCVIMCQLKFNSAIRKPAMQTSF